MDPRCRLTILFDCCHSGSAVELPYVFRPEADGRINLVNEVRQGMNLAMAASEIFHGGFSANKVRDVEDLIGNAKTFFHGLRHPQQAADENGLADENFSEDWKNEGKDVWMFSGCADDQTSADTSMQGQPTGMCSHRCYLPCLVLKTPFTYRTSSSQVLCRGRLSKLCGAIPTRAIFRYVLSATRSFDSGRHANSLPSFA
jgi:hypothetical protein